MAIGFEKWAENINAEANKGLAEAKKMLDEEKKREARDEARLKEMRELAKKIDSFKKEKSSKNGDVKSNVSATKIEKNETRETKQKLLEAKEKEKQELTKIRKNEREERKERLKLRITSRKESEERLKLSTQRRIDSITPSYWFDNDKRYTFKFNRYASNYGEIASDDELKEVTKKIPIQDFRKKNSINLNDETKKTTDGFKDLNKQLDKINNKLNLFAVALSALKIFDTGMEKHKESQQNIHYGYGAGLNYRETKVFGGIAEGFGISKEGLYEEIGEWRRLKDRWGTGTPNLFASEEQQKFLVGNTPTSLGYSLEKLQGMNPVQIYEMIVKDLFLKMKANPSMAGAYEAHARASGFGNAGTLAFKGAMSGVSIEEFMKVIKSAIDTPFGRERSAFEFSTQLSEFTSRVGNSVDKLVMTFEKYMGGLLEILSKLPILSTATERNKIANKMVGDIAKSKGSELSNDAFQELQRYYKSSGITNSVTGDLLLRTNRFLGNFGLNPLKDDEIVLQNTFQAIMEKSASDNDFMEAKNLLANIIPSLMNTGKQDLALSALKFFNFNNILESSGMIGDEELYNNWKGLERSVRLGNPEFTRDYINNTRLMRNESEWNAWHSKTNDIGMTYDSSTNASKGVTIILEDKTRNGIEVTSEYSNGVQTLLQ